MAAQPIAFDILEGTAEPKRASAPRQSWMQELQPADLIVWETPWAAADELQMAPAVLQVFSQPHSAHGYFAAPVTEGSPVIREIDALLAGSEDEVVPTMYAYQRARSFIEGAYGEVRGQRVKKHSGVPEIFPKPLVTTDDVGGIRVSWRTETRQVRANFGARPEPELRSYVYFESAFDHGIEPLDTQHLAGRLAWLTGR